MFLSEIALQSMFDELIQVVRASVSVSEASCDKASSPLYEIISESARISCYGQLNLSSVLFIF